MTKTEKALRSVFAQSMKKVRERTGMTQEALASRVGITVAHVSAIETERRAPRFATIAAIAEALEVAPAELLGGRS